MRVLIVSPQDRMRRQLLGQFGTGITAVACTNFDAARTSLQDGQFDLLITDLRLGAHNGLHLVHVVRGAMLATRCVVFSSSFDEALAAEAIRTGAFYEHAHRVVASAPGYARLRLPTLDARNPARVDRRAVPRRTGRRAADLASGDHRRRETIHDLSPHAGHARDTMKSKSRTRR